ncbi:MULTISPECIES: hypothetical protein [Cysteiniphilum]|uniref:hypothetical protein n=1 Tax=Cysteiniphilum TaxID=2056696 RepID=UPI001786D8FD|nr:MULTISPECIES: hypothetical protein [Cysteiniphilum]
MQDTAKNNINEYGPKSFVHNGKKYRTMVSFEIENNLMHGIMARMRKKLKNILSLSEIAQYCLVHHANKKKKQNKIYDPYRDLTQSGIHVLYRAWR